MNKTGPVLEFFSPAKIALNMEVKQHPGLLNLIGQLSPEEQTFENKLGVTAAYCQIPIDNTFTPDQIDDLCNLLVKELRRKRSIIIH